MFRFPWGDMHSLNLGWFLQKFNELREDWATAEAGIDGALDAEIQRAEDALSDVFDARDAAAASATAAAGSASAANTSKTAAANSATAAASSATLANQKATAAGLSEAAAAQSATAASNSATAAATSATQAGNSASNASSSATAAATSATQAGNSATAAGQEATNAAGSATAAAGSATAAAASADEAESVLQSIPEDYTALSNSVADNSEKITGLNGNSIIYVNPYTGEFELSGTAKAQYTEDGKVKIYGTSAGARYLLIFNTWFAAYSSSAFRRTLGPGTYKINWRASGYAAVDVALAYTYSLFSTGNINYFRNGEILTLENPISTGIFIRSNTNFGTEDNPTYFETNIEYFAEKTNITLIAPVLPELIADTALTINDMRICNQKLYLITGAIPAGAALVPGTNCAQTTLANIIKPLL